MTAIARRCHVSGRVQGVFFRASTRQQAVQLGLAGYARNLDDGRVEVLVVGEPAPVATLIEWLHRGPPSASVAAVIVQEIEVVELANVPNGFATR